MTHFILGCVGVMVGLAIKDLITIAIKRFRNRSIRERMTDK